MSSNKVVRQRMIDIFGEECFIEKLGLRKFEKPVHYKSKGQLKRMKQLTYHHLLRKELGGQATIENGALLSAENHAWFHKQSAEKQEQMNKIFKEYKKQFVKCDIILVDDIVKPFEIDLAEIEVKDEINIKKFNRSKEKETAKRLYEEYLKEIGDERDD